MRQIRNKSTHIFFGCFTYDNKNKIVFIVFLLIFCTFHYGCDQQIPINERPMYGNVRPLSELRKANEDFIKEIEKRGNKEEATRKAISLGWGYCKKGDLATGMKRFNQAWLLNPNDSEIYLGFAYIAAKKNNLNEAIDMNSRAISLDPGYAAAYSNRGLDYLHRGDKYHNMDDINNAIRDFTKAIEINPKDAQNYNDRAACYAMIEEYDKSWSDLQKARELGYKVSLEFIKRIKKQISKLKVKK